MIPVRPRTHGIRSPGTRLAGLLAVVALAGPTAWAQPVIRGVVTDARTGDPLVGGTVQVDGTTLGAVTNLEGRFVLSIDRLPARLVARYIGYQSQSVVLDRFPDEPLRIRLEPEILALGELVVTDESVAEGIVRSAIRRKQAWQDSVRTAYAEAYSRFVLMRELEPVRVEETISAVWWQVRQGTREVVRARRTVPDRRERFRFAGPLPVPNLYDDTVEFEGTRFMGPLHPDAPDAYQFSVTSRRMRDGREVFDLAFAPESPMIAAFTGTMAVEDSTFDVLQIIVRPAVDRAGTPPVIERDIRMEQDFARVGDTMQPVAFRAEGLVRFGMSGVTYPTARYRQVAGLTLHAVDVPVPDTLFASGRPTQDAPDLDRSAWLFAWNPGWVPPTEDEEDALRKVRSAPPLGTAFRPEGLLRNYLAVSVVEAPEDAAASSGPRTRWARPWFWYNRVDGWQVGLQPEIRLSERWMLRPALGYAEAREGMPWRLSIEHRLPVGFVTAAGASHYSAVVGEAPRLSRFLLGLATYGGWDDYFDYYDRQRVWARGGWHRAGAPVALDLTLSVERHRSAARRDFYEGFLRRNDQRDNPPIDGGRLASLTLDVSTGDPNLPGVREAGYAGASVEVAPRGFLGSDFGFVRWSGAVSVRVPTFLVRRSRPASLRLDLFGGLADEDTPPQREGFLHTAVGPLAPGAGFRASKVRLPLSRWWFALFWQHDFGPAVAEWLGFGETRVEAGLFGGHGSSSADVEGERHEVGVFVANLLGYPIRLNVATPVEAFRVRTTVSVMRRF